MLSTLSMLVNSYCASAIRLINNPDFLLVIPLPLKITLEVLAEVVIFNLVAEGFDIL